MKIWVIFLFCSLAINASGQYYSFVENKGQWPDHVDFAVDLEIGSMFVQDDGFIYNFIDRSEILALHGNPKFDDIVESAPPVTRGHAFAMNLVGSSTPSDVSIIKPSPTTYNYFVGNDEAKWASECRAYAEVRYSAIYHGIDLRIYSNDFRLKYDFIVAPGASPSDIHWTYEGNTSVELTNGRIIVDNSITPLLEQAPLAWQIINGQKQLVKCDFTLKKGQLGFDFPEGYDKSLELIIDPELVFSTYSGSTADNFGYTATYDSQGYLYSGSSAFGNGYPYVLGSYENTWAGGDGQGTLVGTDIVISKYDTSGTFMVWSTYLGGSSDELPHSLIVDEDDQLIVFGTTSSSNFPTTDNAYDTSFGGGSAFAPQGVGVDYVNGSDIIVAKFDAAGSSLVASTFLGGTDNDGVNTANELKFNYADEMRGEVEIDGQGNIYIISCTHSDDFPIENALQATNAGGLDGTISKFDPNLENLLWSTYIGSNQNDATYSMAVAEDNSTYVCGGAVSSGFPIGSGGYQASNLGGQSDGFIVQIAEDGSSILNGTFLGSPWYDQLYFVEIDEFGSVYAYGQTNANGDYHIVDADYGTDDSGMLIAKFESDLSDLTWSTVIGTGSGKPNLSPTAFLVDICGNVYISGWGGTTNTSSNPNTDTVTGMPTTSNAFQSTTNGSDFYMLVMDSNADNLVYASFFGGGTSNEHVDGGTSRFDKQGVMYQSVCAGCGGNSDFPILPANAVSPTNNSPNCNNGVFKFDFQLPPVVANFEAPLIGCVQDGIQFINLSTSGTSYLWDFGDNTTSDAANPIHVYDSPGTYTVELFVENIACGFSDSFTMDITISNLSPSSISATADPVYISEGESSQLSASPVGFIYSWSPAGSLNSSTIQNPTATPEETTTYTVTVSNGECEYDAQVTVIVDEIRCETPFIFIPNAFTPNANNENDLLLVRGQNITDFQLTIFDRWGEKVFESFDQNLGWDGTFEGREIDPAVYVYYLDVLCADGQSFFEKGNVTLIR